tara:strand:+ start:133 stop:399 length:267 start_codon:yes stop_codon:yes gene_type:complete
MKTQQHADAFARALARALLQFREYVEAADKEGANVAYATALGLIYGATLCGGISKAKGQELQATLDETRATLMSAFGSAPVGLLSVTE